MPNLANRNEVAFSERKIMKGTDKIEGPEMQKCMECCVLNEMGVLGNDRLLFFFFFFKLFLTFSKMMCHLQRMVQ